MERKFYSVENSDRRFIGFIEAVDHLSAVDKVKEINPDYIITCCLTERANKTYQRKKVKKYAF
jgi:hypothetical protein